LWTSKKRLMTVWIKKWMRRMQRRHEGGIFVIIKIASDGNTADRGENKFEKGKRFPTKMDRGGRREHRPWPQKIHRPCGRHQVTRGEGRNVKNSITSHQYTTRIASFKTTANREMRTQVNRLPRAALG